MIAFFLRMIAVLVFYMLVFGFSASTFPIASFFMALIVVCVISSVVTHIHAFVMVLFFGICADVTMSQFFGVHSILFLVVYFIYTMGMVYFVAGHRQKNRRMLIVMIPLVIVASVLYNAIFGYQIFIVMSFVGLFGVILSGVFAFIIGRALLIGIEKVIALYSYRINMQRHV